MTAEANTMLLVNVHSLIFCCYTKWRSGGYEAAGSIMTKIVLFADINTPTLLLFLDFIGEGIESREGHYCWGAKLMQMPETRHFR